MVDPDPTVKDPTRTYPTEEIPLDAVPTLAPSDSPRAFNSPRTEALGVETTCVQGRHDDVTLAGPPSASAGLKTLPIVRGYEIEREIGRGGMGVVYKARQIHLNRPCALKMILAGAHADADSATRFLIEAEAVAKLHHPNVVQIHAFGDVDSLPYFELEYVEGGSLDLVLDGTPWPTDRAAKLIEGVARGVAEAHRLGIVHRDLKPANVLLALDRTPKITDFGLAKRLGEGLGQTQTGAIMGTPSYMSPEQAEGKSSRIGPATDVYALGAIFYELLTGRPPFRAATPLDTIMLVAGKEPVPPSSFVPGISKDAETIALKCLEKDPAKRYASAEALADDLRRLQHREPIHARPVGPIERAFRWCRRNPKIAVLTTLCVGLVALLITGLAVVLAVVRREHAVTTRHLVDSYVAQANAVRFSRRAGQRFDALNALRKAGELDHSPDRLADLRNAAIASLALSDLKPLREWPGLAEGTSLVTFDPALGRYARMDQDGIVSVRNVADDREIARLPGMGKRSGVDIFTLRFSHDGRFLAASYRPANTVKIWDIERPRSPVAELGVCAAIFHPSRSELAAGYANGSVVFRDLETGRITRSWSMPVAPRSMNYRPDGQQIAVNADQAPWMIQIRDCTTGELAVELTPPSPSDFVWHPDGKSMATFGNDRTVRIWNLATRRQELSFVVQGGGGLLAQYSPDGSVIGTNTWEANLELWDARTGKHLLTTVAWRGPYFGTNYRLAAGLGERLGIYQAAPAREFRIMVRAAVRGQSRYSYGRPAVRKDGRLLAVGNNDGVGFWDLDTCAELGFLPIRGSVEVAFTAEGDLLTTGEPGLLRWPIREAVGELEVGQPRALGSAANVAWLDQSRDSRTIVVIDEMGMGVLRPESSQKRLTLGPQTDVRRIAISPDGRWVTSGGWNHPGVSVWDLQVGGRLAHSVASNQVHNVVYFSKDGHWLLIHGDSGARVVSTESFREVRRFGTDAGFGVSPDGSMLALLTPERILRLVDPGSGKEFARLESPDRNAVTSLTFNADNTRVIFSSIDGPGVYVWDLRVLRERLAELGLDWRLPSYPPSDHASRSEAPLRLVIPGQPRLPEPELSGPARIELADRFARRGEWLKAAESFAKAIDAGENHDVAWGYFLQSLLMDGNLERYRKNCKALLASTKPTVNSYRANTVAWWLVLGPDSVADPSEIVRLAEHSLSGVPDTQRFLVLNTLGAALYRAGRFDEAVRRLEEGIKNRGGSGVPQDWVFLAMSHLKLGHSAEARRWLDKLKSRSIVNHPLNFWDEVEILAFQREAEALLRAPGIDLPVDVFAR
jgi:eukaryotic-like serine/threonine-protein kinase